MQHQPHPWMMPTHSSTCYHMYQGEHVAFATHDRFHSQPVHRDIISHRHQPQPPLPRCINASSENVTASAAAAPHPSTPSRAQRCARTADATGSYLPGSKHYYCCRRLCPGEAYRSVGMKMNTKQYTPTCLKQHPLGDGWVAARTRYIKHTHVFTHMNTSDVVHTQTSCRFKCVCLCIKHCHALSYVNCNAATSNTNSNNQRIVQSHLHVNLCSA